MKIEPRRALRSFAGTLTLAALLWMPGVAGATPPKPVSSTNPVTVNYTCFVTFPSGSAFVPFSLTFAVTAPETVGPPRKFDVVLDPPVITPNPGFQTAVKDIAVAYKLPDDARLVGYELSGGTNLGTTQPSVDLIGDVLVVRAAGPFPAGVPFDLPTFTVSLKADNKADAVSISTGGTSHADPSFSWTRVDLQGAERPFRCQPPTPTTFSSTTVSD